MVISPLKYHNCYDENDSEEEKILSSLSPTRQRGLRFLLMEKRMA